MLNDDTRGATMEAVVSRMKTVESALTRSARENKTDYTGIRFMAISATVPNVQDVSRVPLIMLYEYGQCLSTSQV